MKLRRILVPVDFSAGSLAAVRHACEMARQTDCRLYLLHVTNALRGVAGRLDLESLGLGHGDRLRAYHHLAAVIAENRLDPFRTAGIVRSGEPDEIIVGYADEIHADLIVMGVHGQFQTPPHTAGRVIQRVLGTARCPVLAVPEIRSTVWAKAVPETAEAMCVA